MSCPFPRRIARPEERAFPSGFCLAIFASVQLALPLHRSRRDAIMMTNVLVRVACQP